MAKISAGLLMYRRRGEAAEVLLIHLGGPFWARKDEGAWFIPKGEIESGEDLLAGARREFEEETGFATPAVDGGSPSPGGEAGSSSIYMPLGETRRCGGKTMVVFAFAGDCDPAQAHSNTFEMEWPPRSGRRQEFPEADRAGWYAPAEAERKIHPGERIFLERLAAAIAR